MKKMLRPIVFACTLLCVFSHTANAQTDTTITEIPELVFLNPVLVSGNALKEGAVYKFANVAPGIDGSIKMKKFSRSDIYMQSIDLTGLGWDKAFQPQFGLPGNVAPNQDWYIDFELTFLEAGTTKKMMVDKFTLTALDVDGDGLSIKEYVTMEKATSVSYAPITYFGSSSNSTIVPPTCPVCGKQSMAVNCTVCGGDGKVGKKKCSACKGVGKVYQDCKHPWDGQDATVQGPKDNFANIDTAATSVMATYVYNNKDVVNFRIGAKSGDYTSNAGIRLNSMWFKAFDLAPLSEFTTLPLKLNGFKAAKEKEAVRVSWITENEIGLSHFVVERSIDGKTFSDVATLFANNQASGNNYSFKDVLPASGATAVFYRLRMVEATSQVSYSAVAAIRLPKASEKDLAITTYPNPMQHQVNVSVPGSWQGQAVRIAIYNSNGMCVQSKQCGQATATETVQVSSLPKGIYIVTASTKNNTAKQTLYKD